MSNRPTELGKGYVLQRLVRKYHTVDEMADAKEIKSMFELNWLL